MIKEFADGSIGKPQILEDTVHQILQVFDSFSELSLHDFVMDIKLSLLAFLINHHKKQGYLPFAVIEKDDDEMIELVNKAGMYTSKKEWYRGSNK